MNRHIKDTTLEVSSYWAGKILKEEINAVYENETGLLDEHIKFAVEEFLTRLTSYRFHQIRSSDQVAEFWNSIRQDTVCVDIVLTATQRWCLRICEEGVNDAVEMAAYATGLGSRMVDCDDDLADRTVTQESATDHFKNNTWFLFIFMAAQAFRSKDFPDLYTDFLEV